MFHAEISSVVGQLVVATVRVAYRCAMSQLRRNHHALCVTIEFNASENGSRIRFFQLFCPKQTKKKKIPEANRFLFQMNKITNSNE